MAAIGAGHGDWNLNGVSFRGCGDCAAWGETRAGARCSLRRGSGFRTEITETHAEGHGSLTDVSFRGCRDGAAWGETRAAGREAYSTLGSSPGQAPIHADARG